MELKHISEIAQKLGIEKDIDLYGKYKAKIPWDLYLRDEYKDKKGNLNNMLTILAEGKIGINYIYSFVIRDGKAPVMVFHADDFDKAINILKDAGVKVVSGSTGWFQQTEAVMREKCEKEGKTLFWSSNFSLGVAIFAAVNRYLAKIMSNFDNYKVSMEETHHIHKLDAPSGTAITLAEGILENIVHKTSWVMGDLTNPDGSVTKGNVPGPTEIKIDAIRRDEVPGIHTVTYDSDADTITITHDAHNRSGFALGAVIAAEYTVGHSGMLGMKDLLDF